MLRLRLMMQGLARAGLALLPLWLGGCLTDRPPDLVMGQVYRPSNIHASPQFPAQTLRRVAVLPLVSEVAGAAGQFARDTLEPEIRAELTQMGRFELVYPTPSQLRQWTGKTSWSAEEALPRDFLATLRQQTGCDAVLFCRLTAYRPYPPLTMGWNLKLVEAVKGEIVWAADEVFDAGNPAVANSARLYYQKKTKDQPPLNDSHSILNSPRHFGRYAFHALVQTIPPITLQKGPQVLARPADNTVGKEK
ncbi:hypothetical protein NXS98_10600 [Fontisphaera persica]|uniref:hypothetical protein n=1 Tax=Fontisphaera persica TaxID=2974023 RepID=UPI0024BFC824|nr:hypothetical protein [Fontisphaera persica]WCJ58174.1 hypothetical protein NXS98_10600 [Fontisphaera persica]